MNDLIKRCMIIQKLYYKPITLEINIEVSIFAELYIFIKQYNISLNTQIYSRIKYFISIKIV